MEADGAGMEFRLSAPGGCEDQAGGDGMTTRRFSKLLVIGCLALLISALLSPRLIKGSRPVRPLQEAADEPVPLWAAVIGGFLIISFFPNVAWQAHLGGLAFGLTIGYFFRKRERSFF